MTEPPRREALLDSSIPERIVITESMYGSNRAGLVCGYAFTPGLQGHAIESEAAAGHLAVQHHRPEEFLGLHFSLINAASTEWLQDPVRQDPCAFFLRERRCLRVRFPRSVAVE